MLGCKRLCETNIDELMKVILNHDSYNDAGSILHSDRAVLRAIHFFEENERVDRMAEAIDNDDLRGNFCRTVTVQITLQNKKFHWH